MHVILWLTEDWDLSNEIQITKISQEIDQFVPNFDWLPLRHIDLTGMTMGFYGSLQPRLWAITRGSMLHGAIIEWFIFSNVHAMSTPELSCESEVCNAFCDFRVCCLFCHSLCVSVSNIVFSYTTVVYVVMNIFVIYLNEYDIFFSFTSITIPKFHPALYNILWCHYQNVNRVTVLKSKDCHQFVIY